MRAADLRRTFVAAIFGFLFSFSTLAATATSSFNVTATVGGVCIVLSTDILFPTISGTFAAPTNATTNGVITVTCTLGQTYTIAIGSTANANGSFRRMTNGSGNYIGYNLYSDSGFLNLWGDGTTFGPQYACGGSNCTATGLPQLYTVYGQIPVQSPPVPAGLYSDLLVPVTVNY